MATRNAKHKGTWKLSITDVSLTMSFLEMMDVLNEQLIGKELILLLLIMIVEKEFAVCVHVILMEKLMVQIASYTCQLHMRKFNDGDTI